MQYDAPALLRRTIAEEEKRQKEERKAAKAERERIRLERAHALKRAAKEQLARDREIKEAQIQSKLSHGKAQRQREADWQAKREQNAAAFAKKGRALVMETKEREKRADMNEAAQDKLEREEGTRARVALEKAFKEERAAIIRANREKVQAVKKMTDPSLISSSQEWAKQVRTGAAEDKRKQVSALKSRKRQNKQGHLDRANAIKQQVKQVKEAAREVQRQLHEKKKKAAGNERANDHLVEQQKLRVLAQKKREHKGTRACAYYQFPASPSAITYLMCSPTAIREPPG